MSLINLEQYKIKLASQSPRRRELLAGLGIDFEVVNAGNVDERYPQDMPIEQVPQYVAGLKANAYRQYMQDDELVITADTMVICGNSILGKPQNEAEARDMLTELSGKTHEVVTGVCVFSRDKQVDFSVKTKVVFTHLEQDEIDYYIGKFRPFDKAGAYGIQEWIGYVGCRGIEGSFYNVMGLPVSRLYEELKKF